MSKTKKEIQHKYKISTKGKISNQKYANSKKGKLNRKIYHNTEKYKITHKKYNNIRKRNYDFRLKFINVIEESIEYHHINNIDVVTLPKDLHKLYPGRNKIMHRFMCKEIIKQIYGGY